MTERQRPWRWNRCLFIEGIGRVHVLGAPDSEHGGVAAVDFNPRLGREEMRRQAEASLAAADIVAGERPGKILWAVRFREHAL